MRKLYAFVPAAAHRIGFADPELLGTQGHRLLSSRSPTGRSSVGMATPGCGPTGESNIYINGTSVTLGTRPRLPGLELTPAQASAGCQVRLEPRLPDGNFGVIPFANDSYFITAGKSSYNSLQLNYRHTSGRLQMLLVTRTASRLTWPLAMASKLIR